MEPDRIHDATRLYRRLHLVFAAQSAHERIVFSDGADTIAKLLEESQQTLEDHLVVVRQRERARSPTRGLAYVPAARMTLGESPRAVRRTNT